MIKEGYLYVITRDKHGRTSVYHKKNEVFYLIQNSKITGDIVLAIKRSIQRFLPYSSQEIIYQCLHKSGIIYVSIKNLKEIL